MSGAQEMAKGRVEGRQAGQTEIKAGQAGRVGGPTAVAKVVRGFNTQAHTVTQQIRAGIPGWI